ncbi:MAG: endolytic transglycosylase MltG, partial [Oceanicaulis sp.]
MDGDSEKPETKKSGALGRILAWFAGTVLALAIIAGVLVWGGWTWLNDQFEAEGPASAEQTVQFPRGSGLVSIADQLEAAGVITDARIFRLMVTIDGGDRGLKAGEYAIPEGASMQEIYDILRKGETIQYQITVAEGLTSAMIVRVLEQSEVLTGEIEAVPPEGSLLPETYLVDRGTSRQAVLERMAAAQDALIEELWPQRAEILPYNTPEEAITIASIVEKET